MRTRSRRVTVTAVAAAAAVAAALVSPAVARSADGAVTAEVAIASGAGHWKPSANARVRTVRTGHTRALEVSPRRQSGRKTISLLSPLSSNAIDRPGTAVRATARVTTSQPGRRITLHVMEVAGGQVVARRSVTVKQSSHGWRSVDVSLRTTQPGSRIRLRAEAKRVHGRPKVRIANVAVQQTTTPKPTPSQTPTRPPASPTAACEDIDYSDPAQGVRTFTDDFDGTTIDSTRWRVRDNTFLNQDQAWITKDAVSVHDGYLDIAGHRLSPEQWRYNDKALYGAENRTRDYSTGYVDTIDRFGQRYGNFEVRAWVPSAATMSRGIWPAFWLRADHQAGEIDPMESYGAPTIRSFDPSSSYEWNSWADTAQGSTNEINKQKTQGRATVGTDKIWQGWHTYGVNWSPTCLRYTYDGKTVGIVDFEAPGTLPYFRGSTFADTFHIRLNMQIGSKYWGWADPAHTRSDFNFKIDWVRVHQARDLTP